MGKTFVGMHMTTLKDALHAYGDARSDGNEYDNRDRIREREADFWSALTNLIAEIRRSSEHKGVEEKT